MLIARLSGGLGNQLFQFATFYQISYLKNKKLIVYIGFYSQKKKNNTKRNYHIRLIKQNQIKVLNYNFFLELIFKILFKINFLINTEPKTVKTKMNIGLLDGYFQDFNFFDSNKEIKEKIRTAFSSSNLIKKTIGIHIRRGDYLLAENKKYFKSCGIKYYQDSINFISSQININEFEILIFSDDIKWCKKNLDFNQKIKFIKNDEITDFKLMSRCEHLIISNSTFSWWAAYINNSSNRIVCAPKNWYCDTKIVFQYPKNWVLINN
jgi:hypothetical protein